MRRALGAFETALTITDGDAPFNVVIALRLAGGPTPERLERALAELRRLHPLLGARIVPGAGGSAFDTEGAPAIPMRLEAREGEESWRGVAEEELNRRLDAAAGPLVRCTYLPPESEVGEAPCEMVLTFHHAAVDADGAAALLGRLLDLCGDGPANGGAAPADGTLPPPMEGLFPARFRGARRLPRLLAFVGRQMADEVAWRLRSRGGRQPPLHREARCRILSRQLSETSTAALVESTRRRRVTLHGACSAAVLLAVHRHLYAGRPAPLRYFTFAGLRPYLEPPLSNDGLGCYISMLRHTARMGAESGFWPLAREISERVGTAAHRGDKFAAALLSPHLMRQIVGRRSARMGTTAVSYTGVNRLAPRHGRLRVRGLHAWVSNIPLGPEYTAHVRLWQDRLCWDILYLDADMDAELASTLAGEILARLEAAGAEERA